MVFALDDGSVVLLIIGALLFAWLLKLFPEQPSSQPDYFAKRG